MEQRPKQDARRRDGWVARLLLAQVAVSSLGASVKSPTGEDRWPGRLIRAGAVLIGVSCVVLATWLRRHF